MTRPHVHSAPFSHHHRLQTFADALSQQQIRDLGVIIDEARLNLYCDMIARLPNELSNMILQYLPLHQIYQAQRVSRAWLFILSSPQMLDSRLRQWYPTPDTDLRVPSGLSAKATVSLKAEHIDAYRTGNAFSMGVYHFETKSFADDDGNWSDGHVAYAGGTFAWIDDSDSRTCKSFNLRTGERKSFMAEERSIMDKIAVSASMIAATSPSGRCHIWTLSGQEGMSFQLPSARVDKLLLTNDTAAVVLIAQPTRQGRSIEIITWTLKSTQTRSFSLVLPITEHCCQSERIQAMLDDVGCSIVIFQHDWTSGSSVYRSTRLSLTGKILAQNSVEVPSSKIHLQDIFKPVIANQSTCIWIARLKSHEVITIRYHFEPGELRLHVDSVDSLEDYYTADMWFWKDTVYSWTVTNWGQPKPLLQVINLQKSVRKTFETDPWPAHVVFFKDTDIFLESKEEFIPEESNPARRISPQIFGDDIFHIRVFHGGIFVWCFDKNIELVHENFEDKGYDE